MRTAVGLVVLLVAAGVTGQELEPLQREQATWTPPCEGDIFTDVPCTLGFANLVEQLYRDGITSGCEPGLYCPESKVTRRQMAVFMERVMRGTSTWPPNTVIVPAVYNASGAVDSLASGQALADAIAAIPTAAPRNPSSTNPWHVLLGPGVFWLPGPLDLPPYVTMEGTSHLTTSISCDSTSAAYTLKLAQSVTVRNLAVYGSGASTRVAVRCASTAATLENVYASSTSGSTKNVGIENDGCTLGLTSVTAYASGGELAYGIENDRGHLTMHSSSAYGVSASVASHGVKNLEPSGFCSLVAVASSIQGSTASVASDAGVEVKIAASALYGGALSGPGTCAGVWDDSFVFSASTCP